MCENYICQDKARLLQCEGDYAHMINVRLYQEIVLLFFQIKQDRLVLREHQKNLSNQRKFDAQLKTLNIQLVNKLTIKLIKTWLDWMQKSKQH